MPTAIEYAVVNNWHTQNGAGGGPPAANLSLAQNGAGSGPPAENLWLAQNGAGTGPPNHSDATVAQLPFVPSDELLFAGPLAMLLLVAAVVAAVRRRARRTAA